MFAVVYGKRTAGAGAVRVRIRWRDSVDAGISQVPGIGVSSSTYAESRAIAIAPANACKSFGLIWFLCLFT